MITSRIITVLVLLLASLESLAQAPIATEGLLTEQNKLKVEVSLSYANRDQQGLATSAPVTLQTGPNSFTSLPIVIGQTGSNIDVLVSGIGIKYGLTPMTELYGRANYLYSTTRTSASIATFNAEQKYFLDAWLGVNYLLKGDGSSPGILSFAEVALREHNNVTSSSFKSGNVGITIYKAIDPVMLSFTGSYQLNRTRTDDGNQRKPGDLLMLNPSVSFAVNDKIVLTTGVQWTNRKPEKIAGISQGTIRTSTDLTLGLGYGITKKDLLNFTLKANISGRGGADLRLNWARTI